MGISRRGYRDWVAQRLTALMLGGYAVGLLVYFLLHPQLDYVTWRSLYNTLLMQIATAAALLALVWHAWIGLWTVCTDYLHPLAVRIAVLVLIVFLLASYLCWGLTILWRV